MGFKSGFVGVLGMTNVGKSTFINRILGRKVLITSEKHQTTRNRIRCIKNLEDAQIIFTDTPGLHRPVDKLSRYLLNQVFKALAGLDLILHMVEPWGEIQPYDWKLFSRLSDFEGLILLAVNKIDLAQGNEVEETIAAYQETGLFRESVPISCVENINLGLTLELIKKYLPGGPQYFPAEITIDRPESFVIAEFIREKIFQLTHQEIPYAVAVEVVEMKEREDRELMEIYAHIYVARRSQKGILIGRGGRMIREIGRQARQEIEARLGIHVYLDLQVRVRERWNQDEAEIARLTDSQGGGGYDHLTY
ncbi:MAG: GTPase Era [Candidatus Bipolaricaulia bacterium]